MFGFLALFGPPAFGIEVGLFSILYSAALILYSIWAIRLTVVFADDQGLGYLLTLFDVVMTLPLVIWGTTEWLAAPVAGLWVMGISSSAILQRRRRLARLHTSQALVDPVTGFLSEHRFARAVEDELELAQARKKSFGLVTLRIRRYRELVDYFGEDSAHRALTCICRRAGREVGVEGEGFRLSEDSIAFLLPACGPIQAAETAASVARSVRSKLIEGRRVECKVGYALGPRDGMEAEALLAAAASSVLPRRQAADGEPAAAHRQLPQSQTCLLYTSPSPRD